MVAACEDLRRHTLVASPSGQGSGAENWSLERHKVQVVLQRTVDFDWHWRMVDWGIHLGSDREAAQGRASAMVT